MACSQSFIKVFDVVTYNMLLGLSGTLERLDQRHVLLEKYCKVVDTVTVEEAIENNWLSDYREYKVLLNVDLTEYQELSKKFNSYFSLFAFTIVSKINPHCNAIAEIITNPVANTADGNLVI